MALSIQTRQVGDVAIVGCSGQITLGEATSQYSTTKPPPSRASLELTPIEFVREGAAMRERYALVLIAGAAVPCIAGRLPDRQ